MIVVCGRGLNRIHSRNERQAQNKRPGSQGRVTLEAIRGVRTTPENCQDIQCASGVDLRADTDESSERHERLRRQARQGRLRGIQTRA